MSFDAEPSRHASQTILVVGGGIAGKDAALHRNTIESEKLNDMAKKGG